MSIQYIYVIVPYSDEFQLEEAKVLHRHMLLVFEKVLLRTHGSSHVQFLFFYFCSFRQVSREYKLVDSLPIV